MLEAAGSYYDTVEAFVSEVYGSNGALDVEEEMADFRPRKLRDDWGEPTSPLVIQHGWIIH